MCYAVNVLRAYKYRLYPTPGQAELLARQFGCVRYIYNWALERKVASYKESKVSISRFELDKELTILKSRIPWLKDVASQPLQQAIGNLDRAFTAFFKHKAAFPRFKNRRGRQSAAYPQGVSVSFEDNRVAIPKLGRVKAKFSRVFEGRIKTCTVSRSPSGRYFISVLVEVENQGSESVPDREENAVGVDVGITHFATLSDGRKIANPRHLRRREKQLAVLQQRLARKEKGSANREKARLAVARQHEKVADARRDFLHKLSRELVDGFDTLVFEDLNVAGMVKNHRLASSILDAGWSTFKEYCVYKATWASPSKHVREIGRFEPSTKLCDRCMSINRGLKLSDRIWTCPVCGTIHDRDVLASRNILRFAYRGSETQRTEDIGSGRPGELVETPTTSGSWKQESHVL